VQGNDAGSIASPLTPHSPQLYLASRSPRRRELLRQIGITIDILLLREDARRKTDVDETPLVEEPVEDYVMRVTRSKAEAAWRNILCRKLPLRPVLAADTTVAFDGEIFGKPVDAAHAEQILQRLSGRAHQVLTAVAIMHHERIETALSVSTVEFRALEVDEIRRYVATREPFDKAGAYGIQGRAAAFIRSISGSYSGIMGLSLFETAELLRRFGIVAA
jgi:septum formation protein